MNIDTFVSTYNSKSKEEMSKVYSFYGKLQVNFEASLNNLYEYFDNEEIIDYKKEALGGSFQRNGDFESNFLWMAYTLHTEIETFEICFNWCVHWIPEESSKTHYGIWSLYVIKEKDNPTPQFTYWGDGKWTNGINIGVLPDENIK